VVVLTLSGWSFVAHPPFQTRQEGNLEITSGQALQRKHRSEALLRREAVPINPSLPVIETESEAQLRSKQEVAYRALALLVVAIKGEGLEQPIVEKLVAQYGLTLYLTPKETVFINNPTPSKVDRTQFSWRYESAWVMLWALGYVEDLGKPASICDVSKAVTLMKERTGAQFLADAKPRSFSQVLDEADLIYRYDWAVVDARVNGKSAPAGLDPGVVQERHHALNWLIGYMNQQWDDVSTDT
jgi:hypothetical protein